MFRGYSFFTGNLSQSPRASHIGERASPQGPQPQLDRAAGLLNLPIPKGCKAKLTLVLIGYRDGLLVRP